MGIMICPKHGRSGFVEVCTHVAHDLDQGQYGEYEILSLTGIHILCRDCYQTTGFDNFIQHYSSSSLHDISELTDAIAGDFETAHDKIEGRRVYCAECVAAIQVAEARKQGKKDPFPVYEKTMTSHEQEGVQALEKYLLSRFEFKDSIVERYHNKHRAAAFVTPGNYRLPLTVKTYYVHDPVGQDTIVALTSSFLKDVELNQAKVEFWDAEIWNTWSNPKAGPSGGSRGKEIMLRQVYLNT